MNQAGAEVVQILLLNRVEALNGMKNLPIEPEKVFYMYNIWFLLVTFHDCSYLILFENKIIDIYLIAKRYSSLNKINYEKLILIKCKVINLD